MEHKNWWLWREEYITKAEFFAIALGVYNKLKRLYCIFVPRAKCSFGELDVLVGELCLFLKSFILCVHWLYSLSVLCMFVPAC